MSASLGQSCDQTLNQLTHAFEDTDVNVGQTERIVSALGGGLILMTAASLRSATGLMATLIAAGLIYRGISGHCPMYTMIDMDTSDESAGETAKRVAQTAKRNLSGSASR